MFRIAFVAGIQVLELQSTLEELSSRVDGVKEENLRLRSENQVLGQYIENLMTASKVTKFTSDLLSHRRGHVLAFGIWNIFVDSFIIPIPILLLFGQVFQGTEERPSKWHLFIFLQNWPALLYNLANKSDFVLFIYSLFNKKQLKSDNRRTEILFGVDPKIILSGQDDQFSTHSKVRNGEVNS